MPVIEVISTNIVPSGTFTVNNAAAQVSVTVDPAPYAVSANGGSWFEPGDNINLLSVGFTLPKYYKTTREDTSTSITDGATEYGMTVVVAPDGGAPIVVYRSVNPFINYELALGQFINIADLGLTKRFQLYVSIAGDMKIDMLGVSDDENGKTYTVNGFVKIQHNATLNVNPS